MNIKRTLRQTAVYWPPEGTDGAGNQLYGSPYEIKCRWEDSNELYLSRTGEQVVARSIIYTNVDLQEDGVLFQGKMKDLTSLDDPKLNVKAYRIQRFDKVPDRKAKDKKTLRVAYL